MSVINFELKDEHVSLLKNMKWGLQNKNFIVSAENIEEDPSPFGGDNIYDDINLILNGKTGDFDPSDVDPSTYQDIVYSEEQIAEWDKLISELPIALDILLFNIKADLGSYKTRWHLRDWKKMK
jgi:hypothetical protein